jgi:hypothetical protein
VGDVHTHNYGVDDTRANSIERPDKINTIQDRDAVQKLQDNPNNKVDYQSFVGAPGVSASLRRMLPPRRVFENRSQAGSQIKVQTGSYSGPEVLFWEASQD